MEHREIRQRRTTVDRRVLRPSQAIGGLIGLFLVILGGVALARTGLGSLTSPTETVLGFAHTPLMGIIDVAAGLFFLGAAASSARGSLIGLGLAAVAFGAIVAIEPDAFDQSLGGGRELGVLYVIVGAVAVLAGWAFPTTVVDRVATEDGAEVIDV